MITRQQYLSSPFSLHHEYFLQFSNPVILGILKRAIFDSDKNWSVFNTRNLLWESVKSLKESTDPHFNDIPLRWWDDIANFIAPYINNTKLVELGEINSLSTRVCILKAIAREMIK
jgi:hypothetical protein